MVDDGRRAHPLALALTPTLPLTLTVSLPSPGEDGLAVYADGSKQVKGVDAEAVAATTAGAAEGLWEEHPYPHSAHK